MPRAVIDHDLVTLPELCQGRAANRASNYLTAKMSYLI